MLQLLDMVEISLDENNCTAINISKHCTAKPAIKSEGELSRVRSRNYKYTNIFSAARERLFRDALIYTIECK